VLLKKITLSPLALFLEGKDISIFSLSKLSVETTKWLSINNRG